MSLLAKLERRFGHLAIPNLTLGVIICQVVVYVAAMGTLDEGHSPVIARLELVPNLVLAGEVWRLISFVAIPPIMNILCAFFGWYLFYLMGTALEHHWGTFRYNVFLLVGWLATVSASFVHPDLPASAIFWGGSVFLAFAQLYPHFVLSIFFILPIEIRWLALLTWIGYGLVFLTGTWQTRLLIAASVCNFLLFFGKDILERIRTTRRHMASQAARYARESHQPEFHHRCLVCGITDRSHPQMDFRYCSKCTGACCYCAEHLKNHDHVVADPQPAS